MLTFGNCVDLPLYFQSRGESVVASGYSTTPFSLGTAIMAVLSGQAVSRLGAYRPVLWGGWASLTISSLPSNSMTHFLFRE